MNITPDNFLVHIKNLVTGGGRTGGQPTHDAGYLKRAEGVTLQSLATPAAAATAVAFPATAGSAGWNASGDVTLVIARFAALIADVAAIRAKLGMTADETNARVLKIEDDIDTVGNIVFPIPRDYDEATDELRLRVLASQLTVSTDNDVKLDAELYRKRAGVALTADLAPSFTADSAVPILSTVEQWIEFDLSQLSFLRDDVATIELITNGLNDTDGEEVLIHAIELVYRSTLVSYDDEEDAQGNTLR